MFDRFGNAVGDNVPPDITAQFGCHRVYITDSVDSEPIG